MAADDETETTAPDTTGAPPDDDAGATAATGDQAAGADDAGSTTASDDEATAGGPEASTEAAGFDVDGAQDRLDEVQQQIEEGRKALADLQDDVTPEPDGPPIAAGEGAANAPPG
jgi:hypothetical protein